MIIWNPTNEVFETIFGGIPLTINGKCEEHPAGQKIKVGRSHGNHLINEYEKRGLASLEYGDDKSGMEKKKGEAALKRNKAFKEKQIINYNADNERRKNAGDPYVKPTDQVGEYADELGIELLKPYSMQTTQSKKMAELEERNKTLETNMSTMMGKMTEMMEKMTAAGQTIPEEKTTDELADTARRNQFSNKPADKFKAWLIDNKSEVEAWSNELQDDVRKKWQKAFPEEQYLLDVTTS